MHIPRAALHPPLMPRTPLAIALDATAAAPAAPATPLTKNERLAFAIQAHQARRALAHHTTANLDAACRLLVCLMAAHHLAELGIGRECLHLTHEAVDAARDVVNRAHRNASAGELRPLEAEHIDRALTTLDLQVQSDRLTDAIWHTAMHQVQQHL